MASHSEPLTDRTGTPIEQPVSLPAGNALFGSDVVAETLRALDIPFIALNPGSSYRGLHDSLVNHLGNRAPQMLLCLHEEHAVAIAHGYAKVTGKPMAAAVHANVGLMHATHGDLQRLVRPRAGDRAGRHRPGRCAEAAAVDRLDPHRARPGRAGAGLHQVGRPAGLAPRRRAKALLRAAWLATAPPCGPVYVNLDVGMQEAPLAEPLPPLDAARFVPTGHAGAARPGAGGAGRRAAARRATPGDPVRPRLAPRGRTGPAAWRWPRRWTRACSPT